MKYPLSCLIGILALLSCEAQTKTEIGKSFESYNHITYEYEVILPENYAKEKSYALTMVFTEIEPGNKNWGEAVHALAQTSGLKNSIYFVPKVPKGKPHWKTHPIHHGLNDLMDHLRENYGKKGQGFHFVGYKWGASVAQTYSNMSSEYVSSFTVIHGGHWQDNKQEWFDQVVNKPTPTFVYEGRDQKAFPLDFSAVAFDKVADLSAGIQKVDQRLGSK